VLTVGSIATHNLDPYYLYTGNPAEKRKKRDLIEG
jgi:acetyltransferase-like isoleucine patch superfamily enzyme